MSSAVFHRAPLAGLVIFCLTFQPGQSREPDELTRLADARYQAAVKQYDETWAYYQQARIDSYQVYVWSKLVMDCQRDAAKNVAERRSAIEGHLGRMKKLESLVAKIRRIGFGRSYDVGAAKYYRLEAEYWLVLEKPKA